MAGAAGPGDRRRARPRPRRRHPDRPRRRHPHRPPRRPAVGARGPLGARAGHDRHAVPVPARRPRRRQGADVHGAHRVRSGGAARSAWRPGCRRPHARTPWPSPPRSPAAAPTPSAAPRPCSTASPTPSAAEQFAEERRVIGSLIGTPNQVESVMANFEKRAPPSPTPPDPLRFRSPDRSTAPPMSGPNQGARSI